MMPYGGVGGGGGSAQSVAGTVFNDEAAGPLESDGEVGDFHLRRDTDLLTGPKYLDQVENLLDDGQQGAGDFITRMATRFTLDADASISGLKLRPYDASATDPNVTAHLLDSDRNILASTPAQLVATGSINTFTFPFAEAVALSAGEYYIAFSGDAVFAADLGNGAEYAGADVSVPAGGAETLVWNSVAADFSDAPDSTVASVKHWCGLDIEKATWVGADVINIGLLAVKPAVALYRTVAQSIPNAEVTPIGFDAERYDTHGFHDNVTNNSRITIPAGLGGLYDVGGDIRFAGNASGTARGAAIRRNGTTRVGNVNVHPSSVTALELVPATVVRLVAGDYLELTAYQDSGGALTAELLEEASLSLYAVRIGD